MCTWKEYYSAIVGWKVLYIFLGSFAVKYSSSQMFPYFLSRWSIHCWKWGIEIHYSAPYAPEQRYPTSHGKSTSPLQRRTTSSTLQNPGRSIILRFFPLQYCQWAVASLVLQGRIFGRILEEVLADLGKDWVVQLLDGGHYPFACPTSTIVTVESPPWHGQILIYLALMNYAGFILMIPWGYYKSLWTPGWGGWPLQWTSFFV